MPDEGVVVVTGAGAGIGRSSCEVLADAGFAVAAVGRRAERLAGYETRGTVEGFACDVRDRAQVEQCIAAVTEKFGDIRGLVNAAGVIIEQPIADVTPADIRAQFETNFEAVVTMVQACRGGLARTRGAIVNFSSMLTRRPLPNAAIYTATKGAIEAFSRALAAELAADGVRVNVIVPSLVRSEIYTAAGMSQEDYDAMLDDLAGLFPLGRVGEPIDVAGLVRFLVSDEAAWITGIDIPVDGGRAVG
jgi:meso-butanediol dehydrogenase/(S,S)-butanediol dehydrogenase/diacetyl reductase